MPQSTNATSGFVGPSQGQRPKPAVAALFFANQANTVREVATLLSNSIDREIVDFYSFLMNTDFNEVGEGGMAEFEEKLRQHAIGEFISRAKL